MMMGLFARMGQRTCVATASPHAYTFNRTLTSSSSQSSLSSRALLSVPASHQRRIDKAKSIACDAIVLDLEDGVSAGMKNEARDRCTETLANHLASFAPGSRVYVRINSVQSGLANTDINTVLAPIRQHHDNQTPHARVFAGLVIPKVESIAELEFVNMHINKALGFESARDAQASVYPLRVYASIESARAVINLPQICRGADQRLTGLIMASEDYCADVGITRTPELTELLYARSAVATHAAAFGLESIDLVCMDFRSQRVLLDESNNGKRLGFTGKQAIHPDQVDTIQATFQPSQEQIEWCGRIMAAYEDSARKGYGAFVVDGKMIDEPVVKLARRLLRQVRSS